MSRANTPAYFAAIVGDEEAMFITTQPKLVTITEGERSVQLTFSLR
jgi:hypothetical protein